MFLRPRRAPSAERGRLGHRDLLKHLNTAEVYNPERTCYSISMIQPEQLIGEEWTEFNRDKLCRLLLREDLEALRHAQ